MPNFRYLARGTDGRAQEGFMEASSREAAADQLQNTGYIPVSISQAREGRDWSIDLQQIRIFRSRVKLEEIILFTRQMYSLIRAGIPLLRSIRSIRETMRKQVWRDVLQGVIQELEQGRQLSEAMGQFPRVFSRLVVNIVQAGEESGRLDDAFLELSDYLEREKETRMQVKSALRYPSFVLVAIGVATAVITLFVIPAFARMFESFGAQLPWPTRLIIAVSEFAANYWLLILLLGIGGFFAFRAFTRTEKGSYLWDKTKLRIPIVGSILLRASLARFCRGFSMGFSSGVGMLQCLELSGQTLDNSYISNRLQEMHDQIQRGGSLIQSAESTGLFTPLVLQMLSVGEETGNVDTMLIEAAVFYEREVDYEVKNLTSSIEPILIIVIGAMVLVLALGVFLPMWSLGQAAL
ncbi:MAG: type II secretion system F family protein [Thermodesulfobacteriota bacterium]